MFTISFVFAYFGPETVLPMTSVVATVVGLLMMFGRNTFRLAWRCCRMVLPGRRAKSSKATHSTLLIADRPGSTHHRWDGPAEAGEPNSANHPKTVGSESPRQHEEIS